MSQEKEFPRIGKPAVRALEGAGYTILEQLNGVSEAELSTLHGMGPKAIGLIQEALHEKGMSLKNKK
ncbi:DNA-binding protein [Metabacillus sp. 84]|uniref:DNA-binding protein n=1 Tax=Metabacillus sp. 84 TaxID=3404705 RepID=UPI003CECD868